MTRGEAKQIAFALYKIAEVEEVINNVEVWGTVDIGNVEKLQNAMNALANVIVHHTDRK